MARPGRPVRQLPISQRRFGAHMSIAGGVHHAPARGADVGCDAMQIFVRNQRQWTAPPLRDETVRAWKIALTNASIAPVVAHASYLINLASTDDQIWSRSVDAFVDELERSERLGLLGLVVHPGAHGGAGPATGIRRVARAINTIHRRTRGFAARTTLETTAGQGSSLGHRFEQLARIIDGVRAPERVAICVDTCHIHAAGYDLTTETGYSRTMDEMEETVGLDRLLCFHLNDSLKPLGSRVDRHAHVGQGEIGRPAFERLVNDRRFLGVPMILETPKEKDSRGRDMDKVNLALLRRLVNRPSRRKK